MKLGSVYALVIVSLLVGCAANPVVSRASVQGAEMSNNSSNQNKIFKFHGAILGDDINFESNNYQLSKKEVDKIKVVRSLIAKDPNVDIVLVGHSDSTGSADINLKISKERALSVLNVFTELGSSRNRFRLFYQGSLKPKCENNTEEGRACNRRVEVYIVDRENSNLDFETSNN